MKQLFRSGAASPKDYLDGEYASETLVEVVLGALLNALVSVSSSTWMVHQQGIDIIKFLLPFYHDVQPVMGSSHDRFSAFDLILWRLSRSKAHNLSFLNLEQSREILRHCEENPLSSVLSGMFIDLEMEGNSISTSLLEQTYHSIEYLGAHDVLENNRLMLADPEGNKMKQVIQSDGVYQFIVRDYPVYPGHGLGRAAYGFIRTVSQAAHHPRFLDITVLLSKSAFVSFSSGLLRE